MTGAQASAVCAAARACVGAPFRLYGRDPATGLDCVGLVEFAARAGGVTLDLGTGYAWRNATIAPLLARAARASLSRGQPPVRGGDILAVRTGPAQHHLLMALGQDRFAHADAGLRRVCLIPGPPPWPVETLWRLPFSHLQSE